MWRRAPWSRMSRRGGGLLHRGSMQACSGHCCPWSPQGLARGARGCRHRCKLDMSRQMMIPGIVGW